MGYMIYFYAGLGIVTGLATLFALAALILFFCIFTRDKNPIKNSTLESYEPYKKAVEEGEKFWDYLSPETVVVKSMGIELKASFYNAGSNKSVILTHGYHSDCFSRSPDAKFYVKRGYNVFIFDQRAHGGSGGKFLTMGCCEKRDVLNCVRFIKARTVENSQIILDGISMGAATVLLAGALTENLSGIVADCGYSDAYKLFAYQLKKFYHLFTFPLLPFLNFWCKVIGKFDLKEASPIKYAGKIRVPVLLIHGENDKFVPKYMMNQLYGALKCEKFTFVSSVAGHALSRIEEREACEREMEIFLNKVERNL